MEAFIINQPTFVTLVPNLSFVKSKLFSPTNIHLFIDYPKPNYEATSQSQSK